jgi:SAM-dependent methyltransferase
MWPRHAWFYTVGIGFLAAAKIKHSIHGYSTPKPFDLSETDRCIDYDVHVVDRWLAQLQRYTGQSPSVSGKNVLELGPGSDLGVGVLLLSKGARSYNACDVHDLAARTPPAFYEALLGRIGSANSAAQLDMLRTEVKKRSLGEPSRLNYVVQPQFNLKAALGSESIELVFSQAAFEHFDDIDSVMQQLAEVCRPGAVLVAEIDLKTHSRWVRDHDPNNIYRYSDGLYELFRFRGIPNRVRPKEYRRALERYGWSRIEVIPQTQASGAQSDIRGFNRRFRSADSEMSYLTIMLCATRR